MLVLSAALAVLPLSARAQRATPAPVAAETVPAIVQQAHIDPRQDVNFSALALPATVYVGQQVTYQIGVFLSTDVSQRLRRNPEFVPPDVRSMLAYDLPSSTRPLRREEEGRAFDVHVFQRALFPLTPGTHVLASARLTYSLPLANSFFSREETHSARTGELIVTAKEPPAAGRPTGYSGAVGRISLSARVDTPTSRVGDPVTLFVTVQGVGNVSLFPRPRVALAWGDAVSGAERVAIDSGTPLIQGRKTFEWVVTPRREGTLEVPAVRYPYWNPYTEQYEVAVTAPMSLRVVGGGLATPLAFASDSAPRLTLRESYRGALSAPVAGSPVLWALLGIVPVPALVARLRRRPRRERHAKAEAPLQRLAAGGPVRAAEVRRVFAASIATRTSIGAAAFADGRALVRTLRRVGVTTETARTTQLVMAELDRATYGGAPHESALDLARRAADTFRAIDEEAIPRRTVPGRGASMRAGLVLLLLSSFGAVSGAVADEAQESARFAEGVSRYARGEFPAALESFRELTVRVPRAADAWANLGTAAWMAGDSAVAAIGWQRALRLEPLAEDVRGRLESTPGFRPGLFGDVPPLPVDAATALGVLLWVVGWGRLAWYGRGRRDERHTTALALIGSAALVGVLTIGLAEVIEGHHRVIVMDPTALRTAPALGAERSAEVLTGEGGVETVSQGVWSRVRFSDGRSGWLESRRLASLDLSRAP
ncbi:MAG: BatD family protein [Gemmatimonadota bacterium]